MRGEQGFSVLRRCRAVTENKATVMPIYIVAHEIHQATNQKNLESELRDGVSGSCQISKSVWLVETVIDSPGIKDRLCGSL